MKLRIFAVIFGLSVLAITDPDTRRMFTSMAGSSEEDLAAQCLVVTNYVEWPALRAAAEERIKILSADRGEECLSDSSGGTAPKVAYEFVSCIQRPYREANLRAFPDGDSRNKSTLRKWAASDYCQKLAASYRLHNTMPANDAPETASPSLSTESTPEPAPEATVSPQSAPGASDTPGSEQSTPAHAPLGSFSPSFDCSLASSLTEKLICSDPNLAAADVTLSQSYRATLITTQNKPALKEAQRTWIRTVRDRCSTEECLSEAYRTRIAQLSR